MSDAALKSYPNDSTKQIVLTFGTLHDLAEFKNKCNCADFYIDRDAYSIVGTFTQAELDLATGTYYATIKTDH